jgi:hypothetical protein
MRKTGKTLLVDRLFSCLEIRTVANGAAVIFIRFRPLPENTLLNEQIGKRKYWFICKTIT